MQKFPSDRLEESWLYQFEEQSGVNFHVDHTTLTNKYIVVFYRGLNAVTNLAYEPLVPRRLEEIFLCNMSIFLQIYVESYILGMVFPEGNLLPKKIADGPSPIH